MVYVHLLFLVIGFALLIKGSDFFVEASSRIAKRFGISEFIIGLTLVAIGTSIPELAASIVAALRNEGGLIIGNVVGSNIANIGLILGISAIFTTITVKKAMLKRDGYIMIMVSILFFILAFKGSLNLIESLVFLLIYFAYILFLVTSKKARETYHFKDFLDYFLKFKYLITIRDHTIRRFLRSEREKGKKLKKKERKELPHAKKDYLAFKEALVKDFLLIILGAIAIVFGARYLVIEAIWFAGFFEISTVFIGITVVAIGTSLPELAVSLRAARKGFSDMIIGNIIGSNITNILLVLGISGIINPILIDKNTLFFIIPFMILISSVLLYFMATKWRIQWFEGLRLLILYILFIVLVIGFGVASV